MKTPEQLKGALRNLSKKNGTNPNSLLQMFLFEGILEKISKSPYKINSHVESVLNFNTR